MHDARLLDVSTMTPTVNQFVFDVDADDWSYRAGQHTVFELLVDGETVRRPYTMTSLPGRDVFAVAVKRYDDGTGSVAMHELRRGDTVRCSAPKGNLYVRDYDEDVAFISTGTGASPMIAMLRDYVAHGSGEAYYVHGEKTEASRLFTESLGLLSAERGDVDVTYVLSDASWSGREGFVQDHLDEVIPDLRGVDHYVCGVPGMVVDVKDYLYEDGVDADRVFAEGWEDDAA